MELYLRQKLVFFLGKIIVSLKFQQALGQMGSINGLQALVTNL
jgi:hypothetical protein